MEAPGQAGDALLEEALRGLWKRKCHNWNLVSPTPWLPMIRRVVRRLKKTGIALPLVYNTSGFERSETLEATRDLADVYLTDLRYSRAESAADGSGCAGYAQDARDALRTMWRLAGPLRMDAEGIARSGTICRLLILPGRACEAVENLEWIAREISPELSVSVMAQYVPAHRAVETGGDWARRITRDEFDRVAEAVERLGFNAGWMQDFEGEAERDLLGYNMTPGSGGET